MLTFILSISLYFCFSFIFNFADISLCFSGLPELFFTSTSSDLALILFVDWLWVLEEQSRCPTNQLNRGVPERFSLFLKHCFYLEKLLRCFYAGFVLKLQNFAGDREFSFGFILPHSFYSLKGLRASFLITLQYKFY